MRRTDTHYEIQDITRVSRLGAKDLSRLSPSLNMLSTPAYNFQGIFTPFSAPKLRKCTPIRSQQRFRDEGMSANNIVDANMGVLRTRIEQERVKERLNKTWYRGEEMDNSGWKYKAVGRNLKEDTCKRRAMFAESFEAAASVFRSIGLVFLSGSVFIYLYSLLIHSVIAQYS